MNDWEIVDNRFVAFLDIMGFTNFVLKNTSENVYCSMLKLKHFLKEIDDFYSVDSEIKKNTTPDFELKNVLFSDSILIVTKNDTINAATNLLLVCNRLLAKCMKANIPIKGAVAYGKFTYDKDNSIYFGQPLIDAYQLENDLKLYGMVVHHSFESKLFSFNKDHPFYKDIDHFILKYKTPMQNKKIYHYNLNWIDRIQDVVFPDKLIDVEPALNDWMNGFYYTVSNQPRKYVDNTNDFIKFIFKK